MWDSGLAGAEAPSAHDWARADAQTGAHAIPRDGGPPARRDREVSRRLGGKTRVYDGLIYITRDGGKNWANVTPRDLPEFSRVSLIDASAHEPGTAYLAAKRYQLDDRAPYIYKTRDLTLDRTNYTSDDEKGNKDKRKIYDALKRRECMPFKLVAPSVTAVPLCK